MPCYADECSLGRKTYILLIHRSLHTKDARVLDNDKSE